MEKHPKEVSEKNSSKRREQRSSHGKLSFSFLLLFWIWSDSEDRKRKKCFRFFVFVHTLFEAAEDYQIRASAEGVGATINGLQAHCMLCLGRMSIAHTLSQYDFAFSSLFSSHIEERALQMKWRKKVENERMPGFIARESERRGEIKEFHPRITIEKAKRRQPKCFARSTMMRKKNNNRRSAEQN